MKKPNVVFVITDDQGYGDLSCTGNPVLKTPAIDAFHQDAVRLTDYHVGPTCAPTRAGLLTGHYCNSAGVWHTIGGRSLLRKDEYTMADMFSEAGYSTGLFGKWHLGDNYPYRPDDRGFQEVICHGGGAIGNTPDYWGNRYVDDHYRTNGEWTPYTGYCTDIWFDRALDFIERHKDDDDPFFCYLATNSPHGPHIVHPSYSDPYLSETPHLTRARFFGMIASIDENFAILRSKLREWELEDNTIFVFTTDNGTASGVDLDAEQFITNGYNAGMRGRKGSPYDGGHRVPFFIRWPAGGIDGGKDVDRLTANIDILPTFAAMTGVRDPDDLRVDGTDISPLLHDPKIEWSSRTLVTDSQRLTYPVKWRQSSVMREGWRLINGTELYDMREDPEQRTDLSTSHPDLVAELRDDYERWWGLVSRQFDQEIPIPVGDPAAPEQTLTAHDWRNCTETPQGESPYLAFDQTQIRKALRVQGWWEIDVFQSGTYRIELRRWPRESGVSLRDGIEGELLESTSQMDYFHGATGGVALDITSACLTVGEKQKTVDVHDGDGGAIFDLELAKGAAHLKGEFRMSSGESVGSYYACVKRI
jgi:arylsulfatase A-like enzyme